MSSLLRDYPNIGFHKQSVLSIIATMQGEFGRGVQFNINGENCSAYVILAENQVLDLIEVLTKRIACKKGYSATDWPEAFERVEPKAEQNDEYFKRLDSLNENKTSEKLL